MLHVFIDTNVLLRFYSYSDDTLAEVEKLSALVKAHALKLLVTQQVVDERARNRDKELSESIKRLDQLGASVQMPRFAEHHASAEAFSAAMKNAKAAKVELLAAIREEISGEGLRADKIIQQMFDASNILERTSDVIQRAYQRRELGNPPGKKDSIGDQINWEMILDHVPNYTDLHIITRDGDFKGGLIDGEPNFFLKDEWRQKRNATLYVYAGLAEFTKIHFPNIKVPSDAVRKSSLEKLIGSNSFSSTHLAIAELDPIIPYLNDEECLSILTAIVNNSQISSIITDDDVQSFYRKIYLRVWSSTSSELDRQLENISEEVFGIPF